MSELLISTEHFGFVLSIFVFLLAVEIVYNYHYCYSSRFSDPLSKLQEGC